MVTSGFLAEEYLSLQTLFQFCLVPLASFLQTYPSPLARKDA